MNRASRAFSFLECLVTLCILVILTSILLPIILEVRQKALITSSVSRLRTIYQAFSLYRADYEHGGYNNYADAGMPPYATVYEGYLGLGRPMFDSPCGYKDGIEDNTSHISIQYLGAEGDEERAILKQYRESTVLFRDVYCNSPAAWNADLRQKHGIGVTLGGTLLNHFKSGPAWKMEWWSKPPE